MKDYASMTDQQINREVQKLTGTGCMVGSGGLVISNGMWRTFDPCNNPADAWPIITSTGISLIKCTVDSVCWSAEIITDIDDVTDNLFQCQSSFDYQDENPLRCAMIVFLMMKESEK